jgi:hypothetical protein
MIRRLKDLRWVLWGRMGLREWLWSLLPDRCEVPSRPLANVRCDRTGIRGNENVIATTVGWMRMCDNCHAQLLRQQEA